jgi:hypothetical protein
MTSIDLDMLCTVTGGALVLQPGATADTPNPIVRSRPRIGLQPGATADSPHPIIRVPPTIGLQPGATADSPHPLRVIR